MRLTRNTVRRARLRIAARTPMYSGPNGGREAEAPVFIYQNPNDSAEVSLSLSPDPRAFFRPSPFPAVCPVPALYPSVRPSYSPSVFALSPRPGHEMNS